MARCPSCGAGIPHAKRDCPRCGAETTAEPERTCTRTGDPATLEGTPSPARFVPGALLAGRYRIVAPLGRGGMGEVFRAEDLKLGEPVALKFLPIPSEHDSAWLARFHNEVRVARQVTHPNVCRVHDIGEVGGVHFLSMEYVDGEDLASLLRRVGRFPMDRGLQVARQLCAGLAAAHGQGVLHRDLKPANVMIDGRGRVRLTDFGLAGVAESFGREDVSSGTPAYMAPEQLEGREVSARSDVYALGLVLYEIFTGQRAFEGSSLRELAEAHRSGAPVPPGTLVDGMDPAVESAILGCLEKDPKRRPASALAVMAALPGGDPLAAALAAGETPSPEMVAAAGGSGVLEPRVAWTLLGTVLAGFALACGVIFSLRVGLPQFVPLPRSPEVLADRAAEMLQQLGWGQGVVDRAFGLRYDTEAFRHALRHEGSSTTRELLESGRPAAIQFWYRQGPAELEARQMLGRVIPSDPPLEAPGSALVRLDAEGRLIAFRGVPQRDETVGEEAEAIPDWPPLFAAAGLRPESWTRVAPRRLPHTYADTRVAWEGTFPEQPGVPVRVEAAALRARPVYFEILLSELKTQEAPPQAGPPAGLVQMVFALLLVWGAWLARRNLKAGRGDRRGAARLAAFVFVVRFLEWLLSADHVTGALAEIRLVNRGVAWSLFTAGTLWVMYVALEPHARRLWPHTLVSWSRLLSGHWRDPLIGRDVLVGQIAGVVFFLVGVLSWWAPLASGSPQRISAHASLVSLLGGRHLAGELMSALLFTVNVALMYCFLLLVLRVVVRSRWLSAAAFVAVLAASQVGVYSAFFGSVLWVDWVVAVLHSGLTLLVVTRFGLVATAALLFGPALTLHFPGVVFDLSHWSAGVLLVPLVSFVALSVYGFRVSLGTRPAVPE